METKVINRNRPFLLVVNFISTQVRPAEQTWGYPYCNSQTSTKTQSTTWSVTHLKYRPLGLPRDFPLLVLCFFFQVLYHVLQASGDHFLFFQFI